MGDIIPVRGAISEDLGLEVLRELTFDDMKRLKDAPKLGVPVIQKLRSVHHHQAKLIAEGKKLVDIAVEVGCTTQRLVQLQNDPTFAELVLYYRDQITTANIDIAQRVQAKILDVGEMAVNELHDRLENDETRRRMPVGEVRKMAEFAMDRTVAPPKQAMNAAPPPSSVTINFGTSVRQVDIKAENTIDGTAEDAPLLPPPKVATIDLDAALKDEDGK